MNKNIDKLIWPDPSRSIYGYSPEEWLEIMIHTLRELQIFLELPVEHEPLSEDSPGNGFSVDIRSPEVLLGPLSLTWKGFLGGDTLDNPERLHIYANLFLYSRGKKMITKTGASFLELVYRKNDKGTGCWQSNGWKQDEFGEYEFFDEDDEH